MGRPNKRSGSGNTFPIKLHEMMTFIEKQELESIIGWVLGGRGFIIHNPKKLVTSVLPLFFGQTKYKSFLRQLNMWDFKRIANGPNKGTYMHPYFVKGNRELSRKMLSRRALVNLKGQGFDSEERSYMQKESRLHTCFQSFQPKTDACTNHQLRNDGAVLHDMLAAFPSIKNVPSNEFFQGGQVGIQLNNACNSLEDAIKTSVSLQYQNMQSSYDFVNAPRIEDSGEEGGKRSNHCCTGQDSSSAYLSHWMSAAQRIIAPSSSPPLPLSQSCTSQPMRLDDSTLLMQSNILDYNEEEDCFIDPDYYPLLSTTQQIFADVLKPIVNFGIKDSHVLVAASCTTNSTGIIASPQQKPVSKNSEYVLRRMTKEFLSESTIKSTVSSLGMTAGCKRETSSTLQYDDDDDDGSSTSSREPEDHVVCSFAGKQFFLVSTVSE